MTLLSDPEMMEATLRARRRAGITCAQCQTLKIRCEYIDLEEDCKQCTSKGLYCRHFESGADPAVELGFEEDVRIDRTTATGRQPLSRRLLLKILDTCTQYTALKAAVSDPECEQVVENLKSEWLNVGRLLLALAAVDMSLFTIDSQSLFQVDVLEKKAVAASSVGTGLGLLCDLWFYGRYYRLQPGVFLSCARDTVYGSYIFFSLSARLPSLGALISLLALVTFVGSVAYRTLAAFVIVLAILFSGVMGLQFIARGTEVFYSCISGALGSVAGWIQLKARAIGKIKNGDNLRPPTNTVPEETSRRPLARV
ncbi:hypothetical protein B0H13DRAFT_301243 [Mycena leptocephala]|nr:hypothetical protein B0H13DRAFT_301243 [Mycena leptocephala]